MKEAGFKTSFIKFFPFMKYSFMDEYNRTSLFIKGKKYPVFGRNFYKGFLNIHQSTDTNAAGFYNIIKDPNLLWDTAVVNFRMIVEALQHAGVMVVFVNPPERKLSANRQNPFSKTADSIFKRIADDYHLKHFHFEDVQYSDRYFVDDIHLNEPGTRIYSLQLADSITAIFPQTKQPPRVIGGH